MITDDFILLVYKNLKGEISDSDFDVLNQKTLEDTKLAEIRSEIEASWDIAGDEPMITTEEDKNRGFEKLLSKVNASKEKDSSYSTSLRIETNNSKAKKSPPQIQAPTSKFRIFRNAITGVAAGFIIVIGTMWFFRNQVTTYDGGIAGQQITLKDNSIVDLAANSTLEVSSFSETREMTLKGTANFKVTSNPESPFVVYTTETSTEVIGTEFLLSEITAINKTILQVKEGEVTFSVFDLSSNVSVIAGETASLLKGEQIKKIKPFVHLTAKKVGSLTYTDQDLPTVLEEIMILFNTSIEYDKDLLMACKVSGIIAANNVDSILNSLAKQFQFTVEQDKTNWIIRGGKCN